MDNMNYNQQPQYNQQQYYQQPAYQQPVPERPAIQLPTGRGIVKTILLSLITFGIYGLVVMGRISNEVNIVCSKYDGKKTTNFWVMTLILTPLTLGIYGIVWYHKLFARIGDELNRRNINYGFGAGTFWGWVVLGTLIVVGPIIGMHKLYVASNKINADYNEKG